MKFRNELAFVCEETFYGLLCCVFKSFSDGIFPNRIELDGDFQQTLDVSYENITMEPHKAERVYDGIQKKLGDTALRNAYMAFLSADTTKATCVYKYLVQGFLLNIGSEYNDLITNPHVLNVINIARKVGREAHLQKEFVRFEEVVARIEGGMQPMSILYSDISPEHNVIEPVTEHFSSRFPEQPFLIHDVGRKIAAVYDTKGIYLMDAPAERIKIEKSQSEQTYQQLWKLFYESIAVPGRINPKLRRQNMPKKFWKHMTEFREGGASLAR